MVLYRAQVHVLILVRQEDAPEKGVGAGSGHVGVDTVLAEQPAQHALVTLKHGVAPDRTLTVRHDRGVEVEVLHTEQTYGTGRTDLPGGDATQQYESLFNRLLRLDDATRVFPGHDYKGRRSSSIGDEKVRNPRLQVGSVDQYVALMNSLNLPSPKMMDVAIPANLRLGLA